jgi:hypothetical protein
LVVVTGLLPIAVAFDFFPRALGRDMRREFRWLIVSDDPVPPDELLHEHGYEHDQ